MAASDGGLRARLGTTFALVQAVAYEARDKDLPFMAGSIAYHAFLSLPPLLVLLLATVSFVGSDQLATIVLAQADIFVSPQQGGLIENVARSAADDVGASAISIIVLVWGASRIVRGIKAAFAAIYGTDGPTTAIGQTRDTAIVFFAVGVSLVAVVSVSLAVSQKTPSSVVATSQPMFTVLTLSAAFYPIYYVFPNEDVSLLEALPGTLVAALGWTALKFFFGLYAVSSFKPDLYGFLSAVILLLLWLYAGGFVLLLGAVVNAVFAGRNRTVARPDWPLHDADEASPIDGPVVDLAAAVDRLPDGDNSDGDKLTIGDEVVSVPDHAEFDVEEVDGLPLVGDEGEAVTLSLHWRVSPEEDGKDEADNESSTRD